MSELRRLIEPLFNRRYQYETCPFCVDRPGACGDWPGICGNEHPEIAGPFHHVDTTSGAAQGWPISGKCYFGCVINPGEHCWVKSTIVCDKCMRKAPRATTLNKRFLEVLADR
jgi:hypothetical protein